MEKNYYYLKTNVFTNQKNAKLEFSFAFLVYY